VWVLDLGYWMCWIEREVGFCSGWRGEVCYFGADDRQGCTDVRILYSLAQGLSVVMGSALEAFKYCLRLLLYIFNFLIRRCN
jgi:hypothetical protein